MMEMRDKLEQSQSAGPQTAKDYLLYFYEDVLLPSYV